MFWRLGGVKGVLNRFLYNGKELQDELNLGWYDYGARMYDPALGRWNGVDASAETYSFFSPYHFVGNNPIKFVDFDGKDYWVVNEEGALVDHIKNDERNQIAVINKDGELDFHELNDQEFDSEQLENFTDDNIGDHLVTFISDENINALMSHGNVHYREFDDRWPFANTESFRRMDYPAAYMLPLMGVPIGSDNITQFDGQFGFFIFENNKVAYNIFDSGQFLWGQAMKRLGFSYASTWFGSNMNEIFSGFDSEADQQAIKAGFNYNVSTSKSSIDKFKDVLAACRREL